jgi:hypothetical protein
MNRIAARRDQWVSAPVKSAAPRAGEDRHSINSRLGDWTMTRKLFAALALTAALATAATAFTTNEAEAKCKFGCGLAIGLGAGFVASSLAHDGYYGHGGYGYYGHRHHRRARSASWHDYCFSRYKSYDPYTGTYLGYDGYRHTCR